ncbi:hypothetical protein RHMOL_Rhmol02G0104400 [Rhododendron molle]|uniref:Uncharacterized protein n=1 Tax=Rhododendron molle TaxID=49168 RepID=A0ACC0PP20_RHOML|nr:hypothetical protein RHMOL_Rhmol02G0104400 [Rhododendron molle]
MVLLISLFSIILSIATVIVLYFFFSSGHALRRAVDNFAAAFVFASCRRPQDRHGHQVRPSLLAEPNVDRSFTKCVSKSSVIQRISIRLSSPRSICELRSHCI